MEKKKRECLTRDGHPVNILLPTESYNELKRESEEKYLSMGALIRFILAERYFQKGEKK